MNDETLQVFSGSAITPEELLVLAEFAAPSHFVSDEHLHDAADNLAEWTDHRSSTIVGALRPGVAQGRAAQRRSSCCARRPMSTSSRAGDSRPRPERERRQSASPPPSSAIVCPVT